MPANTVNASGEESAVRKPAPSAEPADSRGGGVPNWRPLAIWTAVLLAAFCKPLIDLIKFTSGSDLYSYILLIPAVSGYLIWLNKDRLAGFSGAAPRKMGVALIALGAVVYAGYWSALHTAMDRTGDGAFSTGNFLHPGWIASELQHPPDGRLLTQYLKAQLSPTTEQRVVYYDGRPDDEINSAIAVDFDRIIHSGPLYEAGRFSGIRLSEATAALLARNPQESDLVRLNRMLLVDAFPGALKESPMIPEDGLSLAMLAFVLMFTGGCCWFMSASLLWELAFPIGFLIFLIPIPSAGKDSFEAFLQQGSAWMTNVMFTLSGASVIRNGLIFNLPGVPFPVRVAPECSGIHSTLILFITSLIAGHLFLRSPWKRAALTAFVLPLALVRNGFRIFTISELCIHISPKMIDSFIHRRGGPIFFALSLIPFFLLLMWLQRSDRKAAQAVLEKTGT